MASASPSTSWQRALIVLTSAVVSVVVVASLYWAQTIFIPVALAIYLAFVLSPLVRALERLRLSRVLSVLLTVVIAAALLGGVGWIFTQQVAGLVKELPQYTGRFKAKIDYLRASRPGSPWEAIEKMVRDIAGEPNAKPETPEKGLTDGPQGNAPAPESPPAVAVQPASQPWVARLPSFLGSLVESLGGFALTIVLALFMLLKREDLRNRLIWLAGHGRLTVTTKAFDDAGQRISRFLLAQAIVNGAFGLSLGVGLFFIGLDYAFLWGFLAAVLRYIPYVGTWIAAIVPITLSLGMFDGWLEPLLVVGLFLTIELVCSNVVEPRVFGRSLGVSEVALLTAAAFWAFLWGPIGLVLSNPLTVCLVVLGKHVPQLEFFNVLLGDEPTLDADVSFYQRLLARDQDEAAQLVQTHLQASSHERVHDELLVPALVYARRDRERDELSESDEHFILQATQEIVDDLGERNSSVGSRRSAVASRQTGPLPPADYRLATELGNGGDKTSEVQVRILGCPARHEADRLALEMLRQLLDPAKWRMEVGGVDMLSADWAALAAEMQPSVICIGAVPPGGLAHSRYLCKRLRNQAPNARIMVGRWGLKAGMEQNREQLKEAGADEVDATLLETRNHLHAWFPVLAHGQPESAAEAAVNQV